MHTCVLCAYSMSVSNQLKKDSARKLYRNYKWNTESATNTYRGRASNIPWRWAEMDTLAADYPKPVARGTSRTWPSRCHRRRRLCCPPSPTATVCRDAYTGWFWFAFRVEAAWKGLQLYDSTLLNKRIEWFTDVTFWETKLSRLHCNNCMATPMSVL